jgi:hypothetical protein
MAEMGPGLRREDEDGRIALNHQYASKALALLMNS